MTHPDSQPFESKSQRRGTRGGTASIEPRNEPEIIETKGMPHDVDGGSTVKNWSDAESISPGVAEHKDNADRESGVNLTGGSPPLRQRTRHIPRQRSGHTVHGARHRPPRTAIRERIRARPRRHGGGSSRVRTLPSRLRRPRP